MAETTGIAWCDSTFNAWIGCTKVSPGCDHCYAEALDARHRYGGATHWGPGVPRHRTSPGLWKQPLAWNRKAAASGKRWLVFTNSLADVFDNEIPAVWRHDLWKLIQDTPHLTWLLLTKRIGNVVKMWPVLLEGGAPPNIWLGASVVNQDEADRDIPKLLATPAAKRFVSYEPALGPVNWNGYLADHEWEHGVPGGIAWLIVGGESSQGGAKARLFDLAWARSTVMQCKAAGVPVFVKQLGSSPDGWWTNENGPRLNRHGLKDRAGADPAEWPEDLRVQEFPA